MIITPSTVVDLQSLVQLGGVDASGVAWRINRDGLTGMGEPAPDIDVQQRPRQRGGWAGAADTGPRYPGIVGTITAPSPALLNAAIDLLKTAVTNYDFTMTITESGRVRMLTVRRAGETIVQKVSNLVATYSVLLVALDPRFFGASMTKSTALPSTSGGLSIPFTLPTPINATVATGQIALTNPGNESGKVKMRVDGPCHGPVITHKGSGVALVFAASLVLGTGDWLDIDMDKHTVLANGQASRRGFVTSAGWSEFEPGTNVWGFTAPVFDSGALLTVTGTPAAK